MQPHLQSFGGLQENVVVAPVRKLHTVDTSGITRVPRGEKLGIEAPIVGRGLHIHIYRIVFYGLLMDFTWAWGWCLVGMDYLSFPHKPSA